MTLSQPARLSETLPGTWQLVSRIDITASGERRPEPSLGEDPVALLIYDRSGNFAAQFMRRDRSIDVPDGPTNARNNSRAQGGYDAYFGTYTIDDKSGTVTQRLTGALSRGLCGSAHPNRQPLGPPRPCLRGRDRHLGDTGRGPRRL